MQEIYLITGANGHLGNTIIRMLAHAGKQVRALILPSDEKLYYTHPNITSYMGDVRDIHSLDDFFALPENTQAIVVHAAGIVSIASKTTQLLYDVNVLGTENVLEQCRHINLKKLVYISSVHAIPEKPDKQKIYELDAFDPSKVKGAYAKTKALATRAVLNAAQQGMPACVVHPSGIIGPYDYGKGHITQLVVDYMKNRLLACVKGGYDFVDVRDVARGVISCCERGVAGQCYILSNEYYSAQDLLNTVHKVTGKRQIKTVLPLWFAKLTAPFAEAYYKLRRTPALYTSYSLYTLTSNSNFSHSKASAQLAYKTRPMAQTIKDTIAWLKKLKRI